MTDEIGPFDPGPFYKEEEISKIIYDYFYETQLVRKPISSDNIAGKIVKYLDEKRKGEKHE